MKIMLSNVAPVATLQWVRGPITAGMRCGRDALLAGGPGLQWVRGPITAVMQVAAAKRVTVVAASMGPRSDNRGYDGLSTSWMGRTARLQWVRGPITAVMPWQCCFYHCPRCRFNGSAVR